MQINRIAVEQRKENGFYSTSPVTRLRAEFDAHGLQYRATRQFDFSGLLAFPSQATATVLIQAGARKGDGPDIRLMFSPETLDSTALLDLQRMWKTVCGQPLPYFLRHGVVTEVQISSVYQGVSLNEILLDSSTSRVHGSSTTRTGIARSVFVGTSAGIRAADVPSSANGPQSLRIQRHLRPKCRGMDLRHMPNAFEKLKVVSARGVTAELGSLTDLFLDSARVRGVRRAAAMLQPDKRRSVMSALNDPANAVIPATIWNDWPKHLARIGL